MNPVYATIWPNSLIWLYLLKGVGGCLRGPFLVPILGILKSKAWSEAVEKELCEGQQVWKLEIPGPRGMQCSSQVGWSYSFRQGRVLLRPEWCILRDVPGSSHCLEQGGKFWVILAELRELLTELLTLEPKANHLLSWVLV